MYVPHDRIRQGNVATLAVHNAGQFCDLMGGMNHMAVLIVRCSACGLVNDSRAIVCTRCGQSMPIGPAFDHSPVPVTPSSASVHSDFTAVGSLVPDYLLHGRYRILSIAGVGGMGAVYKALDMRLGGRVVAVKELSKHGLSPQEIADTTEAFTSEALLLASLHHSSLPSIHDHFRAARRWYLVMDFIEGETLEQQLHRTGSPGLPVAEVLHIADQLCDVLEFLHHQEPPIIFRDLKPSNVMLTHANQLYLIDFGIARLFTSGKAHDTVSLGTPGYAAPEQYGSAQTTVRSDIFSLGVTLHQLLTGRDPSIKPFSFASILSWNPRTPQDLETLIMRMVEIDEDRRPPTIVVLRQELEEIARPACVAGAATPPLVSPVRVQKPHISPRSPRSRSPQPLAPPGLPASGRPGCVGVAALSILGVVVGVVCIAAVLVSGLRVDLSGGAQSAAMADAQSTLASDLPPLYGDIGILAQDTYFTPDLTAYAHDWATMQGDYHTEQHDAQLECGQDGGNASMIVADANVVTSDLVAIQIDERGLRTTAAAVNWDLQQVQSDMTTIQGALQNLEQAASTAANHDNSVASDVGDANAALAIAQQQISVSNHALQSAQSQGAQYDEEAKQLDQDAQQLAASMKC